MNDWKGVQTQYEYSIQCRYFCFEGDTKIYLICIWSAQQTMTGTYNLFFSQYSDNKSDNE